MHKRTLAFLMTTLACLFASNIAYALPKCPATAVPQLSVTDTIEPVKYIREHSSALLTALHKAKHEPAQDQNILGLTGGDINAGMDAEFELINVGSGVYCLQPTKVNAHFAAVPEMYIASNFKSGSCEYDEVLEHEKKHVAVLEDMHTHYAPLFKHRVQDLVRAVPPMKPFDVQYLEQAKGLYLNYMRGQMSDFMQMALSDIAQKQQEIDTNEEYTRMRAACEGWGEKLSGH